MVAFQPVGEADALKRSVESPLGHGVICEGGENVFRDLITEGQVYYLDFAAVNGVSE